jgi:hypothetical protein
MVEHLPSKCKDLNSNPSTGEKKNKKEGKKKEKRDASGSCL